jgi:hypothetical protein
MSFLWASKRGLSEAELLDLLGTGGEPLPQAHWSPLYLAAEQSLLSRSGLIGFFHEYFREAVQKRYLPTQQEQQAARLRVADYFSRKHLSARKVDELPWLLVQTKSWQQLYDVLSEVPFMRAAMKADQFQLRACWTLLESESLLRVLDAYRPILDEPEIYPEAVYDVIELIRVLGYQAEVRRFVKSSIARARQSGSREEIRKWVSHEARLLEEMADLTGAMERLKEWEQLCRAAGDKKMLAASYFQQAGLLSNRDAERKMSRWRACVAKPEADLGHSLHRQSNSHAFSGESKTARAACSIGGSTANRAGDLHS